MDQVFLWILDAGHAPDTPGKRSPKLPDGSQLLEWEFARNVCDRVARALDDRGIAYTVLTPRTKFDLRPYKRAQLANEIDQRIPLASRLVSIHGNASRTPHGQFDNDAGGIVTFHYPGSLFGSLMATRLQAALVAHSGLRDRGVRSRDNLDILEGTHMPSVLAECGFYTNLEEAKLMASDAGRQLFSDAIVDFIANEEALGFSRPE